MNLTTHSSWRKIIGNEAKKNYFMSLKEFVINNYETKTCYPPKHLIFNAFKLCRFDSLKVVILGQDPYHGDHQADGLSFSISRCSKYPPSLINIFKNKLSQRREFKLFRKTRCFIIKFYFNC